MNTKAETLAILKAEKARVNALERPLTKVGGVKALREATGCTMVEGKRRVEQSGFEFDTDPWWQKHSRDEFIR